MAGQEVSSGLVFLGALERAADTYRRSMDIATTLETQAAQLRGQTTEMQDVAIRDATLDLVDRANSDSPPSDRDLLKAVLRINQHKPSTVSWSGPPDITRTLDNFDDLIPGTPVIIAQPSSKQITVGVVADQPVSVAVRIMDEMGGLPGADISFGIRAPQQVSNEVRLAEGVDGLTLTHGLLAIAGIGVAVQRLIDSQAPIALPSSRGQGEITNCDQLEQIARAASQLTVVANIRLDTTHIDLVTAEAVEHNIRVRTMRAEQIRGQRRTGRRTR